VHFINTTTLLTQWYDQYKRPLPWRKNPEPYRVWLSEIILQQTRVTQGMDYYYRFVESYPTVAELANAPLDDVLKLWEGLGYYSRARNLHTAAKQIGSDFGGEFPQTYNQLLTLKGVGTYTAAAIASICFGEKRAVVDGNVYRVLARLYGIDTPINSAAGIKQFQVLADKLIAQTTDAGRHNQAMMEFGALQCVPKNPDCLNCILRTQCVAFATGTASKLPVKQKAKPVRHRYLHYFILKEDGHYYLNQRDISDIWGGLYQFPLVETERAVNQPRALSKFINSDKLNAKRLAGPLVHLLSHQKLHITFWRVSNLPEGMLKNNQLFAPNGLRKLALPIALKRFVDAILLHLPLDKT
jgi:A/G-specific adenine glycosylase